MPIVWTSVKDEKPKTPEYLKVNKPKPNAIIASAKIYNNLIQNFLFICFRQCLDYIHLKRINKVKNTKHYKKKHISIYYFLRQNLR